MPIYEYECTKCGKITEAVQSFTDKPLKKCGGCSGKLNKLISHSSFHLKGSGWYVTDYANKSKSNSSTVPEKKKKTEPKTENKKTKSTKKND